MQEECVFFLLTWTYVIFKMKINLFCFHPEPVLHNRWIPLDNEEIHNKRLKHLNHWHAVIFFFFLMKFIREISNYFCKNMKNTVF